MTIRLWRGRRSERFCRLCSRAPRITMSDSARGGADAGRVEGAECGRVAWGVRGDMDSYFIRRRNPPAAPSLPAQRLHRVEPRRANRGIEPEEQTHPHREEE